jgi:hypothetical protein
MDEIYSQTEKSQIKVRKSHAFLVTTLIAVNVLIGLLLFPYAQKTANSHVNSGPFFATTLFIISGLLFLFGLSRLLRQSDYKLFGILLVFATTLTFWGIKLQNLLCQGCLNSG